MAPIPLLRVAAIAFAAGDVLALGLALPLPPSAALAFAAVAVVAGARTRTRGAVVALAFAAGGFAAGTALADRADARRGAWEDFPEKLVRVEGRVDSAVLAPSALDGGVSFDLALDGGRGDRVRVRLDDPPAPPLRRGDRVRVRGWLSPLARPTNPGEEDRRPAAWRAGRVAELRAGASGNALRVAPGADPRALLDDVRERARLAAVRAAPGDGGALLAALLLGDRGAVPREAIDALRETGTIHLLAISGLHVILLGRALRAVLDRAPLGEASRRAAVLAFLAAYATLVGFEPPVARAAVMAGAGEIAAALGRRLRALDALALSGLAVLALDPGAVLDAGAQLSFAAVLALVLLAPALERLLARTRAPLLVVRPISLTLAATLATAPILAARFSLVSPGSLAANLAAAPAVSAILVAGAPALVVSAVAENPASDFALRGLGIGFDLLVRGLALFARLPFVALPLPPPGPVALAVAAAALVLAAAAAARQRRATALVASLAVAAAATLSGLVLPPASRLEPPAVARLTVLDVGQGAAAVLETAGGFRVAIDCGSSSRRDAAARVVAPFLAATGRVRLDLAILSHPDADHVNAASALVRRRVLRRVIGSEAVAALGIAGAAPAAAGDAVSCGADGAVEIRVLHPPRGGAILSLEAAGDARARNDASLAVAVEARGAGRAIVPGDLQDDGLRALLDVPGLDLRADVLVLPHHGSFAEPLAELLARVRPRAAVASARAGFLPEATRAALAAAEVPLLETSRDGAIEIRFEAGRGARAVPIGRGTP